MFPLNDLSILFIALLVIAFAFLGLFVLFGLFIYMSFNRNNHPISKEPPTSNLSTPTTSPSCITISDWVTFLSSEKHGLTSTYFTFFSIAVALFGIVSVITDSTRYLGYVLIIGSVIYFIYSNVGKRLQRRSKLAKEILNKIMSGELTDSDTVRKLWVDGQN